MAVDPAQRFGQGTARTAFDVDSRLQQTVFTINSVRTLLGGEIYLTDVGPLPEQEPQPWSHQHNVHQVDIAKLSPAVSSQLKTHPSKGWCEAVLTGWFLDQFGAQLQQTKWFVKISGRYFFTDFDAEPLHKYHNGVLVKNSYVWPWNQRWNDTFGADFAEKPLTWTPTTVYAVHTENLNQFRVCLKNIENWYAQNPQHNQADYEVIFAREVLSTLPVDTVKWQVAGWAGSSGKFFDY
jgi:hypothetical protein